MEGSELVEEVASFPIEASYILSTVGVPGGGFATMHEHSIRVWSGSGVLEATLEGTDTVSAFATNASGDIVLGSIRGAVTVWRDNACVLTCAGHTAAVWAVAVSPVDGAIVSGSEDNAVIVWSASTGECVATLEGHFAHIMAVCVLPNGDIVSGSWDRTVRVWGRGSWACTAVYDPPGRVYSVVVLPGGGIAVCGSVYDGFVSVWRDGEEQFCLTMAEPMYQLSFANGIIFACSETSVCLIQGGSLTGKWTEAETPCVAMLTNGTLAVIGRPGDGRSSCTVLRVVRPPRMATIHIMVTAWLAHGGVPPAVSDTPEGVLARTVSLRRFCRPRGEGSVEVVEPFARDIVGYM